MEPDAADVQPVVEVRAAGAAGAEAGSPWSGVGGGVRAGAQAAGPLWISAGVDVIARPPLAPRITVAPELRLYATDPRVGRAALSVAAGGGIDVRLDPSEARRVAPLLFGEASLDVHVRAPWSVRLSVGYASGIDGKGAATLGLGLLWMRGAAPPPPVEEAPAPVAEAERWLPYPVCAWTSERVAERAFRDLEARRPPLPGERAPAEVEGTAGSTGRPPRQGEVVVVAFPGDIVHFLGDEQVVDADGISRFTVRVDGDEAQVDVDGGGRSQPIPLVAQPGRVTWLRAEAPEPQRVGFEVDSYEITEATRERLVALAGATGRWGWELHGSYSPEGAVDRNRALAEARAEAVRAELLRLGLSPEQVRVGPLDEPDAALSPEEQRAVRLVPVREGGW
jgi:hypothetical protein